MGLMSVMHSSYVILSFLYFFVCEHEKCGRTIELDTFWGVLRGMHQRAEFESATKRSQIQLGLDNPKPSECAWSCKRPR